MCPFLFPNQTRRFKYFSGFQVPRWCCSASLLNSPTPPALSAPRCHSSSLPHHSAPACFSLPIRHTPLIKPTPLTCALCAALAAAPHSLIATLFLMLAPGSPAFLCLISRFWPCLPPTVLPYRFPGNHLSLPYPTTILTCPFLGSACLLPWLSGDYLIHLYRVLLLSLPAVLWLWLFLHWGSTRLRFTDITHQCPGLVQLNLIANPHQRLLKASG